MQVLNLPLAPKAIAEVPLCVCCGAFCKVPIQIDTFLIEVPLLQGKIAVPRFHKELRLVLSQVTRLNLGLATRFLYLLGLVPSQD